ncbi:hypothetical protein RhiirC2_845349 [Rhizophagus irregularis]|uniref:Uncharacterized protein n=1 Tax=Rhizophagus irregularis TaxID=588596 RepID=A0A2N1NQW7_9GLOM|nr:hypothetical protein RhiirC2_845349 [Rhizophagus irregularis]
MLQTIVKKGYLFFQLNIHIIIVVLAIAKRFTDPEYVSDDFVHEIFNTYMVYTFAMKDDIDALDTLKSFLCRALSFHIGEKLNGNHNHEETLHKIKGLDHITKDLVLKFRLYADVINDI